jgi:xanthine/CO dehydrogenase XdhC/CoxF family maturation factor
MIQELLQEGFTASEAAILSRIHNPVGLDIGAENPEQIALAILAEIQAVLSGHAGGLLREKKSSIHAPAAAL